MTKALIFILLVIIFAALFVAIYLMNRRRGKQILEDAFELEEKAIYGPACYLAAVAAGHGADRRECDEMIIFLWERYGPFDLSKELSTLKKEKPEYESYGQGQHIRIEDYIRKSISKNN
ncbi:MAG: hypothetical protein OEV42_17840 [Deltaproteobacteria bacterium]|nr:hypothetical protein [Deltaproteobacteria bacterium]